MKTLRILALIAMFTLCAAAAHADTVTWTLVGVTFGDGGTASGSFTYDADDAIITNINVTTTAGSALVAHSYTDANSFGFAGNAGEYRTISIIDDTLDRYIRFEAEMDLFKPGTVALGGGKDGDGFECMNCNPDRFITAGSLSGELVLATPEPGSLALLSSGLLALAGGIRRKLFA